MDSGINQWWIAPRWGEKYEQGVDEYIEKAFSTKSQGNQICCPCECCHYRYWRNENVVRDHLICNGFVPRTDKLSELGIDIQREATGSGVDERRNLDDSEDDVAGLLHDVREAFTEGPNGAFTCTFGDGKKFVMESMNSSWRVHKCRVKKKHYYPYDTDELRWANKSDTISVPHFKDLLEYWHCEKIKMMLPVIFSFLLLLMISPAYGSPEYCPVGGEVSQVIPVHTVHNISPTYGSREYCLVGGEVSQVIPVHTIHEISPAYGSREYCPVGGEVSQVIPVHTIHEISRAYGSREYCPVGGEVSQVIPVHELPIRNNTIHDIVVMPSKVLCSMLRALIIFIRGHGISICSSYFVVCLRWIWNALDSS